MMMYAVLVALLLAASVATERTEEEITELMQKALVTSNVIQETSHLVKPTTIDSLEQTDDTFTVKFTAQETICKTPRTDQRTAAQKIKGVVGKQTGKVITLEEAIAEGLEAVEQCPINPSKDNQYCLLTRKKNGQYHFSCIKHVLVVAMGIAKL